MACEALRLEVRNYTSLLETGESQVTDQERGKWTGREEREKLKSFGI